MQGATTFWYYGVFTLQSTSTITPGHEEHIMHISKVQINSIAIDCQVLYFIQLPILSVSFWHFQGNKKLYELLQDTFRELCNKFESTEIGDIKFKTIHKSLKNFLLLSNLLYKMIKFQSCYSLHLDFQHSTGVL